MTMRALALRCLPLICALSAAVGHAEVLVAGPGDLNITQQDVVADSLRVPEANRKQALAVPQTVGNVAMSLYARRAMAEEALKLGLDQNENVQAALKVARDRVLGDAYLLRLDQLNTPTDAVLDDLAKDEYKAHPERFALPEQVHIRHILISGKDEGAEAKANELLEKLKQGGDFEALAKENSADTGSAAKGGDLGFFAKGRMVPEFETAAFALEKPGDLSGVVKTNFGYHILQLVEKKPAGKQAFEDVKEALRKEALAKYQMEPRQKEVKRLMDTGKPDDKAIEAFSASYR